MSLDIGKIVFAEGNIVINEGLECVSMEVTNTGDRSIQVCSHYHFFECNSALKFDREKDYGMHLDIPSGTGLRFEPGQTREVQLVPYEGERKLFGFDGLVSGNLDDPETKAAALKKGKEIY